MVQLPLVLDSMKLHPRTKIVPGTWELVMGMKRVFLEFDWNLEGSEHSNCSYQTSKRGSIQKTVPLSTAATLTATIEHGQLVLCILHKL